MLGLWLAAAEEGLMTSNPLLPVALEAERLRRAEHARKAYFTGLALKSARARKKAS